MWDEIDVGQKVWVVPAARTKAHREHRVPLSPRALEIANQMQLQRRKGRLVFPGRGDGISVSEAGVRYVMQSLGCGSYTVHGFRSAFRDWCGEQTNFPREVAEAALAHRVGNAVEQAYARGDLFEKRARLMTAWAAFCEVAGRQCNGDTYTAGIKLLIGAARLIPETRTARPAASATLRALCGGCCVENDNSFVREAFPWGEPGACSQTRPRPCLIWPGVSKAVGLRVHQSLQLTGF